MNFVPFPSIEGFHNVVKFAKSYPHLITSPITYRGKIKCHGTNSAVFIENGEVMAQSRSQFITPIKDNAGFAKWVESTKDFWKDLPNCVVFGEWCGPGIMKGTALNQIPRKIFAVFAIEFLENVQDSFLVDPEVIGKVLANRHPDVYVLPWYGESFEVDFFNDANLRKTATMLNEFVDQVEPCDPWVKDTFGIEGTAEGIVYYPDTMSKEVFSNCAFKAKGEKHRVVKVKEAVQIDPEIAENVDRFVEMFLTEARMEQGLAAVGGSLEMKNIGAFLKWVSSDVFKESVAELEASNLTWEQVQKSIQNATRNWFIDKNKQI